MRQLMIGGASCLTLLATLPFLTAHTPSERNGISADAETVRPALQESGKGQSPATQPPDTTTANQKVYDALEQEVSFDFDETEFGEVMDTLRENFGINIILHISAMEDSLPADEPIRFKIHSTRLKDALSLMLKSKNACFTVQNGVLLFISCDVAQDLEFLERRIIDVRQLIKLMDQYDRPPVPAGVSNAPIQIFAPPALPGGGLGGGGGGGGFGGAAGGMGGGLFQVPATQTPQPSSTDPGEPGGQALLSQLTQDGPKQIVLSGNFVVNPNPYSAGSRIVRLMEDTVYPDEWVDMGGSGTIDVVGGLLIVVNRFEVNDDIQDLVQELEYRMGR